MNNVLNCILKDFDNLNLKFFKKDYIKYFNKRLNQNSFDNFYLNNVLFYPLLEADIDIKFCQKTLYGYFYLNNTKIETNMYKEFIELYKNPYIEDSYKEIFYPFFIRQVIKEKIECYKLLNKKIYAKEMLKLQLELNRI